MTYNIYYHVTETQLRVVARSTHWKRAETLANQYTKETGVKHSYYKSKY